MNIHMDLKENSYDILVERGVLAKAGQHLNLDRRVLIVTDSGVPAAYTQTLANQCKAPKICTLEPGEGSKSLETFGHTIGHGIESSENLSELYHGECVALGLIPMCLEAIRPRVIGVLQKCNLYNLPAFDWDKITEAAFHDKKADGDNVTVTMVPEIGSFALKTMKCMAVIDLAKNCFEGETE